MKPLTEILATMAERYRWHRAELLLEVERVWPEAVGPQIARATEPIGWLDGTLTVAVPSPVWTQELRYLEPQLRSALNQRLTGGSVDHLKIVVRPGTRPRRSPHASDPEAVRRLAARAGQLHEDDRGGPH